MSKSSVPIGGSVSQSALVADGQNEITPETTSHASRETDRAEITHAIRTLFEQLDTKDRGKIQKALADAQKEAQRPKPDKEEVVGALEPVVKYAKTANSIGEVVVELKSPLSIIAHWVGTTVPIAARLFGLAP